MPYWGKLLGGIAGKLGSVLFPTYSNGVQINGKQLGEQIGEKILPWKEGGMIEVNVGARVFNQPMMLRQSRPKRNYQKPKKSRKKK